MSSLFDFTDDSDFGLDDAMLAGVGYGLYRHGQDRQTATLVRAVEGASSDVVEAIREANEPEPEPPVEPAINNLDYTTAPIPQVMDDYIGQEPLKRQIMVHITSAKRRGVRLPHTLLASGYPGVGKTTMARLIAKVLGVPIIEVVPPFKIETLIAAALTLPDHGILFIDEIHKLTDGVGARGAEMLLKVLEDGVAPTADGKMIQLPNITIIGATTDRDKLPEPVVDRFKIKPHFQKYNPIELARICIVFAYKHEAETWVTDQTCEAIAHACRATPRIIEEMVMSALDLGVTLGNPPTPQELLDFLEVEPDGLTRVHIDYLTSLRLHFGREARDGGLEFIVGEAAMQQILRETKPGLGRIERFLVERGLIDRTPRGRRLTPLGIQRAEQFIRDGKGVAHV